MAVGTLAICLTFIAGTFLTGIYFATFSTEKTIAAVAAEEGFAKMQIFGIDADDADLIKTDGCVDYSEVATPADDEWLYPSVAEAARQYSWAAICRRMAPGSDLVQCTVFVSREAGGAQSYWEHPDGVTDSSLESSDRPHPVRVHIVRSSSADDNVVTIEDAAASAQADERTFVSDGSILVDDATGDMYRVLERSASDLGAVLLDRDWGGGDLTSDGGWVWVIPPAVSGGRNPCCAVYQKILRFPGR